MFCPMSNVVEWVEIKFLDVLTDVAQNDKQIFVHNSNFLFENSKKFN